MLNVEVQATHTGRRACECGLHDGLQFTHAQCKLLVEDDVAVVVESEKDVADIALEQRHGDTLHQNAFFRKRLVGLRDGYASLFT